MDDTLQAQVTRALIANGQSGAAALLARCELRLHDEGGVIEVEAGEESPRVVAVEMVGPPEAERVWCDGELPITRALRAAVRAALPPRAWIERWSFTAAASDTAPDDAAEHAASGERQGGAASNQAADAGEVRIWQHLRFRSESELRIAQALDRAGVLFLPNCKARLGPVGQRENREPDFLICADGRWGILEVDGEPFHPPARTVHDHERARLFKAHGIPVVEHFDATACYRDPDSVVRQFLELLRRS